jgi:hypothetical protein
MARLHLKFLLGFKVGFSSSDGWERVYESSDEGTCIQNIRNSSTRSHASEEENCTRNRCKNCKCKSKLY